MEMEMEMDKSGRKSRGYRVDVADLLFTPNRHFLVRNNGQKVCARRLMGKTIVLHIIQFNGGRFLKPGDTLDIVDAYRELLPFRGFEFVFVPIYIPNDRNKEEEEEQEQDKICDRFNNLFSTIPFPAVPFSDMEACSDRVVNTFSLTRSFRDHSYWVIIDPTGTVVATRAKYYHLFKLFGGAELYPLSLPRIRSLFQLYEYGDRLLFPLYNDYQYERRVARDRLILKWDRLLASPTRDFVLSSNGSRVPISSLKGKVIGLYFCENKPYSTWMEEIKEGYREAKLRGYDFEIVQINYHCEAIHARHSTPVAYFSEQQHYENISWLRLPFKDTSCRKLQRIFECKPTNQQSRCGFSDCLVIIDRRGRADDEIIFEFYGAEVIGTYGIAGYPFTRQSVIDREYRRHRKDITLQSLLPRGPGLCQFTRRRVGGDGFDLVSDSQLTGKRVLVLFDQRYDLGHPFISMLKSKYVEQAEEDKFEVVYVSSNKHEPDYNTQDMPWLVHPHSDELAKLLRREIFKYDSALGAAAFDIDGQLISKKYLVRNIRRQNQMEHQFPFFKKDLRRAIEDEVRCCCKFDMYMKVGSHEYDMRG